VLDLRGREGRVRHDVCRNWEPKLDAAAEFNRADLGKDQSRDLCRVESSRGGGGEPGR
jgi:acetolactate decarboxylase